jgi:hypothetical protein
VHQTCELTACWLPAVKSAFQKACLKYYCICNGHRTAWDVWTDWHIALGLLAVGDEDGKVGRAHRAHKANEYSKNFPFLQSSHFQAVRQFLYLEVSHEEDSLLREAFGRLKFVGVWNMQEACGSYIFTLESFLFMST